MNLVNISEQNESWHDTWCMTSVEYFDWLIKQPVNQVPPIEPTVIYSKVVVSCGCHSFPKPLYQSLYICIRYLDVAMCYLNVTKGISEHKTWGIQQKDNKVYLH